ncbi:MAG: hypothetical protein FJ216_08025 [Ignavibacteria bacterium]|nr:hypothetical protein [Ignavibacteria bacterium]
MKRLLFLTAVFLYLFCVSNLSVSQINSPYKIIPGSGFDLLRIGDNKEDIYEILGIPAKYDGKYLDYYYEGLEFSLKDDKISTIFFIYRSKTHMTFDGKTDKGIGFCSTIPEVIRAYGKPDRIGNSVVSEYGAFPGAHEYYLEYNSLGISFTFYDNELAGIRVYASR